MKIKCPHCGVGGSVNESLAGRKLRCPKCSRVFCVKEETLPEVDEIGIPALNVPVTKESLPEIGDIEMSDLGVSVTEEPLLKTDEMGSLDLNDPVIEESLPEIDEIGVLDLDIPVTEETLPDIDGSGMLDEDVLYAESKFSESSVLPQTSGDIEEASLADMQCLEECSVCNQFFAAESLQQIDSQKYCALCRPEVKKAGQATIEEVETEPVAEDKLLEIMDKDDASNPYDAEEEIPLDERELFELLNNDDDDDDGGIFGSNGVDLVNCSGCGEAVHPEFLETIGSERLCVLCIPEGKEQDRDVQTGAIGTENAEFALDEEGEQETEDAVFAEKVDDNANEAAIDNDENDADKEKKNVFKESCSVCGEKFNRNFMQEIDSKLYCGACQPEVVKKTTNNEDEATEEEGVATAAEAVDSHTHIDSEISNTGDGTAEESEAVAVSNTSDFTVVEIIREAWQKTKGAKVPIWAGTLVMYAIVLAIFFGGATAFQAAYNGTDPMMAVGVNGALMVISTWLGMLMTGGLMLIGVRRVVEQRVSWKMIFDGFSQALAITVAIILQLLLVAIGFVLLVLPGIYLSVGYMLTLPLMLDKGLGPWEALEASRKAIHTKWWTVFSLYLVMLLLSLVAAIPLGLGLIWVLPMFYVLSGVLYVRFFGRDGLCGIDEDEQEYYFEDEE